MTLIAGSTNDEIRVHAQARARGDEPIADEDRSDDLRGTISNFFQRGEYERNPVASVNNSVAELFAATNANMESEARLFGAKYFLLQAG